MKPVCGIPSMTLGPCELEWGHDGDQHDSAGDGFFARAHEVDHHKRQSAIHAERLAGKEREDAAYERGAVEMKTKVHWRLQRLVDSHGDSYESWTADEVADALADLMEDVDQMTPPSTSRAPRPLCSHPDRAWNGPIMQCLYCGAVVTPRDGDPPPPNAEPQTKAKPEPVCKRCYDTHMMTLGEDDDCREVMCTSCPTPCPKCGSGNGGGPYCKTTPCDCACHLPLDKYQRASSAPTSCTHPDRAWNGSKLQCRRCGIVLAQAEPASPEPQFPTMDVSELSERERVAMERGIESAKSEPVVTVDYETHPDAPWNRRVSLSDDARTALADWRALTARQQAYATGSLVALNEEHKYADALDVAARLLRLLAGDSDATEGK